MLLSKRDTQALLNNVKVNPVTSYERKVLEKKKKMAKRRKNTSAGGEVAHSRRRRRRHQGVTKKTSSKARAAPKRRRHRRRNRRRPGVENPGTSSRVTGRRRKGRKGRGGGRGGGGGGGGRGRRRTGRALKTDSRGQMSHSTSGTASPFLPQSFRSVYMNNFHKKYSF